MSRLLSIVHAIFATSAAAAAQSQPAMNLSDLQRFMQLVEQQVEKGESWSTTEGKYVVVSYVWGPKMSSDRAARLAADFDQEVAQDCTIFKLDLPTRKIPVYLYPSAADLQAALHMPITDPMTMGYWTAIPLGAGDDQDLKATAAGELGQALIHDQIGLYGCSVFSQGVDYYLRAAFQKADWIKAPKPILKNPLRTLTEQATTPAQYLQGGEFVAYLLNLKSQDPEPLKKVLGDISSARLRELRSPTKTPWSDRVEDAFKSAYGESLSDLEAGWRKAASG